MTDVAEGEQFDYADFSGETWEDREFVNCSFVEADMSELSTRTVIFTDCDFTGVNLSFSKHVSSAFRNCHFERAHLNKTEITDCSLLGSVITNSRVRPMKIVDSDLSLMSIGGLDLSGVVLSRCRLREANLSDSNLTGADLTGSDLTGVRAIGTKLGQANLRGARIDPMLWLQAKVTDSLVDHGQAMEFAAAHGLNIGG
ncbi:MULTISPECIES: pentapeptide repeat-containing protein [Nocardiaceae]|uniref:pentapeptide repeat-containing protein n=1 Tax=Nocardia sp. 348MFTsu5.1 TaxID=1172185 RepID=UPI0003A42150